MSYHTRHNQFYTFILETNMCKLAHCTCRASAQLLELTTVFTSDKAQTGYKTKMSGPP